MLLVRKLTKEETPNKDKPTQRCNRAKKQKTKKRIYEATVKPIITYGDSLWGQAVKTNIIRLERIQNNAMKMITGSLW